MPENLEVRPTNFDNFIGQQKLVETLKILISSSQKRKQALDHILFYGPPGTGKTTLANIVANVLESKIKYVQGPLLEKKADVLAVLANISQDTILFIDEIHGINKNIEELLYSAMEEFVIDLQIGVDGEQKIMRMKLPHFTLIAASTKLAQISTPLQNRFGYIAKIVNYTTDEMVQIISNSAAILKLEVNKEIIKYIASFSNNTPRIANNLLKRIRDFALVLNKKKIDREIVNKTFDSIGIYNQGLSQINIEYLNTLFKIFKGKSVALDVLANVLKEHRQTIINIIEPPLIEKELIEKTPRGRRITSKGKQYLTDLTTKDEKNT
ncbi:Holliday junction branch migration DNA helicase RuvB [Mesomycoplasma ovipneumoniae]|uniref:Holliday junction branch migration complex subunit RuvB n=2 Tax=Mesomycoplasma ovipneumoniae TaxID=29562 RepID=A0AAJ2PCA1_9BACT|nr:Holliday junction branch migration DNA helicase RuvB [Mesomycoplasma ovipneumoniae]EXU60871.1 Holliday junction DNA helicase RuvB [Mesomycoplasma ovipneumoniae 14811]MDF9627511.1 Holliday junction branch migration DNA helicase RuvB [Mesomycoplasma ovipneumoniae]MDO4157938.1 Holliday junction branch migration DNA helicase RuvB [Mesomycoplasma ovipneumoniae]MDO4158465.1 Holliday junction branch migration DNA helicase RuvB [Mesomycoplasma ovipneumoniae]MDO6821875.1 Holliday junction branch mig